MVRPLLVPHAHGRAGARIGPAHVGRHLALLHLAAAALAVVVGVPALAVGPHGTGIVGIVAELAHILDHHVEAVPITLAEMTAAGVVGPPAADADRAVADIGAAVALLAEAVVLELQHGGEGEGVIGARDVDVLGPDAGVGPQDLARVFASDGGDRAMLVV